MTKNLTELSERLLAKFSDRQGIIATGRISEPPDFASELEALRRIEGGDAWISPSDIKAFNYRQEGTQFLAIALSMPDDELAELYTASSGTVAQVEVPGSVFLYLADRMSLMPNDPDPLWSEEYICGPAGSDSGVSLDVIKGCLPAVTTFQIHGSSVFRGPVPPHYIANYICTFDQRIKRAGRLSQKSLNLIREIFLQEREHLVERNLFEALLTPSLRHAFLEVYRILEFIFVLPRTRSLLQAVRDNGGTLDISVMQFAHLCNRQLGWKRVELDSIKKIFDEHSRVDYTAYLELADNCKPFGEIESIPLITAPESERLDFVNKVAEKFYKLRNQVVHQLWPDQETYCSHSDWQALIEFSISCVLYLYEQHLSSPE